MTYLIDEILGIKLQLFEQSFEIPTNLRPF